MMKEEEGNSPSITTEYISETHSSWNTVNIKWTISKFSFQCTESGKAMTSSVFPSEDSENTKWFLKLYPNGKSSTEKDYVGLFVKLCSSISDSINASYKLELLNSKDEVFKTMDEVGEASDFTEGCGWGSRYFIKRDILLEKENDLLPNDEFTVRCEITWLKDTITKTKIKSSREEVERLEDFRKICHGLLKNSILTDVSLVCEGRQIFAHKCILISRSGKFRDLLSNDILCKELVVTDLTFGMLDLLVDFIYQDVIANGTFTLFMQLLMVAKDYRIASLFKLCEFELNARLTHDNALQILEMADKCSSSTLKKIAIELISSRSDSLKALAETDNWKTFLKDQLELMTDILHATAKRRHSLKRSYEEL